MALNRAFEGLLSVPFLAPLESASPKWRFGGWGGERFPFASRFNSPNYHLRGASNKFLVEPIPHMPNGRSNFPENRKGTRSVSETKEAGQIKRQAARMDYPHNKYNPIAPWDASSNRVEGNLSLSL